MKLGPVPNLEKRNMETRKNSTMTSCRQIVTSLPFLQFIVNLEQSGSRIPDAWSVKLTFSLTVTNFLTSTEKRTKKSLTELPYYCFE